MNAKEFIDALNFKFEALLKDKFEQFLDFLVEETERGEETVLMRFSLEDRQELPYYVWVLFDINASDEHIGIQPKDIYLPDASDYTSYFSTPQALQERRYFAKVVEDLIGGD